jgi:hypothetical protein
MKVKSRREILDLFSQLGYNVMFGKQYKYMGDYSQIRNIKDGLQLFSELGYNVEYQRVTKNTKLMKSYKISFENIKWNDKDYQNDFDYWGDYESEEEIDIEYILMDWQKDTNEYEGRDDLRIISCEFTIELEDEE